ncbi:Uncharacterised protein [Klebsiella pneumoniae]|uniref:Uncharacterized protein n=1 Tax=Klebsiella pneumoniae TaxID=573 RepID=A0A2X1QIQ4_KLEPN|nr:Uncharacterised protein [Klebsiella pneumoniae]
MVSCGETTSASSVPSKPITAISSGTRSPAWAIARSAPAARESGNGKHRIGLLVLRQQLLHRPFTGRRAKILRVGHLLIRQTAHVQHAFIAALAQTA